MGPIKAITDFIFIDQVPEKSDIILIPGGSLSAFIERACELYNEGFAPYLLPSGGINKRLKKYNTEWEWFYEIARSNGVPDSAILKEDRANNTFENAKFSAEIIKSKELQIQKAILVTKAFHSRRALLTYQTELPSNIKYIVCPVIDSRKISRNNWFQDQEKIDKVFDEIVKIGKYFPMHVSSWNL
jgi:uncharacterized SAM-binding protein YcdF (DUF218 family)